MTKNRQSAHLAGKKRRNKGVGKPGNKNGAKGPHVGGKDKTIESLPQPRPEAKTKLPRRRKREKVPGGGRDFPKGQNSHTGEPFQRGPGLIPRGNGTLLLRIVYHDFRKRIYDSLGLIRYFAYYHRARTHLALDRDAPDLRPIERPAEGRIVRLPEVGGLHHRYLRQPRRSITDLKSPNHEDAPSPLLSAARTPPHRVTGPSASLWRRDDRLVGGSDDVWRTTGGGRNRDRAHKATSPLSTMPTSNTTRMTYEGCWCRSYTRAPTPFSGRAFGRPTTGAFYISVTRWATSCSLGSATSTHVMSRSLLAKPAQACPGRGGAARATQRENGRSVHYGLDRLYAHLREHMIRLEGNSNAWPVPSWRPCGPPFCAKRGQSGVEGQAAMKGRGSVLALLLMSSSLLWSLQSCLPLNSGSSDGTAARRDAKDLSSGQTVTVRPTEIDDVLYNPGMGFADFHFGIGSPLPLSQHPRSTVAYVRWYWGDLEPAEGQYDFGRVDRVIEQARAMGETLAFRIMTAPQTPQWLLEKGVDSAKVDGGIFPDFNNPVLLGHHEKLIRAFGARYARSPDIDHVDIGAVGCWGEWNIACCRGVEALCKRYYPTEANQIAITDQYLKYFAGTPLVMLVGGPLRYAVSRGSGWRGDCFGDYGMFGPTWNHMEHVYEPAAQDPLTGNAWKTAPVQFEVCGVMQDWYDKGFDIDLILRKGLEWHASVVNAGYAAVPAAWRPRVDEFLKKLGYRMVLRELTHSAEARPGEGLPLRSRWQNVGVAPFYHRWPLAYRLRSSSDEVVAQWVSTANPMHWLPGAIQIVEDIVTLPENVRPANYLLDVAILTQDGSFAHVDLAIAGKRSDHWYPVSTVAVRN